MSRNTQEQDRLIHWIALRHVEGVGNVFYKRLIDLFDGPERVFSAPYDELRRTEGMPDAVAGRIKRFGDFQKARDELKKAREDGVDIVTLSDARYPALLRQINDPPPFLYVKGQSDVLPMSPCVAVVGTRFPSAYGEETTEEIVWALVREGMIVVSGMAKGIDAAAHRAAMTHKGRTVAVLGTGINRVYPAGNKQLAHDIADHGVMISEYSMDTPPLDTNFPERNRIISGLSLAVIVIEASLNSGTMITVSHALDQGRDVFALPGPIHSMMSQGTNRLIKQGCGMIDSVDNLVTELKALLPSREDGASGGPEPLPESYAAIMSALSDEPVDLDTIIVRSKFDTSKVMSILTEMEIKGIVRQVPGKRFVKMEGKGNGFLPSRE